jgi:hypothetical protein
MSRRMTPDPGEWISLEHELLATFREESDVVAGSILCGSVFARPDARVPRSNRPSGGRWL